MSPMFLMMIALFILFLAFLWRRFTGKHARYRSKARKIHKKLLSGELAGGRAIGYLRKINPYVFEELVLEGFLSNGYQVARNERYSGDGGVDGRVRFDGNCFLIQCKRYKRHINADHVEEFSRLCERNNQKGFFVHTGRTGSGSWQNKSPHVRIVSGESLVRLLSTTGDPDVLYSKTINYNQK